MERFIIGRINVRTMLDFKSGQHLRVQLKQERQTHRAVFSSLITELKDYETSYDLPPKEEGSPWGEASERLQHHSVTICDIGVTKIAVDRDDRWISMIVADQEPQRVADEVQSFLRNLVEKDPAAQGASIDVDLVCPPDVIQHKLTELMPITELTLVVRRPNMYDFGALQQAVISHRANQITIRGESDAEEGMRVPSSERREIAQDVSQGDAALAIKGADGSEFSSESTPAEFEPPSKVEKALVALAVAIALVWWIETYFPHGGPSA